MRLIVSCLALFSLGAASNCATLPEPPPVTGCVFHPDYDTHPCNEYSTGDDLEDVHTAQLDKWVAMPASTMGSFNKRAGDLRRRFNSCTGSVSNWDGVVCSIHLEREMAYCNAVGGEGASDVHFGTMRNWIVFPPDGYGQMLKFMFDTEEAVRQKCG